MPTRGTRCGPVGADRSTCPARKVGLSTASVYPEGVARRVRARRPAGLRRRRGHGLDRPADPRGGRAAHAVRAARHPGAVGARPDPAGDPAGVGHRPVGEGRPLRRRWPTSSVPTPWCCTRRSGGSASTPATSSTGWRVRENDTDIRLAVENMYPWRGPRSRELEAYLPHWDPVPQPYDHVTLDLSHTSTSGSDAMEMVRRLGPRLRAPAPRRRRRVGARRAPRARARHPAVRRGARDPRRRGYAGHVVVEVATRRAGEAQRELDLAEALAFARLHLATPA